MTNVRRASETDESLGQVVANRILRELRNAKERDERKAKQDAQRRHKEAWATFDEETRNLVERCALCGMTAVPYAGATRLTAIEWVGAWGRGHIEIGACGACSKLWTYTGAAEGGALALYKSLGRFDLAHYYPHNSVDRMPAIRANNRKARHGLSWAGAAYRARLGGLADPGDPETGYSHIIDIDADSIDFYPAEPEPLVSRRLTDA